MNKEKAVIQQCRQKMAEGKNLEDVLSFLRKQGLSKVESIRMVSELKDTSVADSKQLVHLSNSWSDTRGRDEAFHENLEKHLRTPKKRNK